MRKNIKNGFTLIEMLVVFVIIGILSSIAIWNYNSGNKTLILSQEAARIASDIRRAQSMAGIDNINCALGYDARYGVRFDNNQKSYKIFSDCNLNGNYDAGSELVETIDLNPNVKIGLSGNVAEIVFIPPNPAVALEIDGAEILNSITITLSIDPAEAIPQTKQIKVNKYGMIDID